MTKHASIEIMHSKFFFLSSDFWGGFGWVVCTKTSEVADISRHQTHQINRWKYARNNDFDGMLGRDKLANDVIGKKNIVRPKIHLALALAPARRKWRVPQNGSFKLKTFEIASFVFIIDVSVRVRCAKCQNTYRLFCGSIGVIPVDHGDLRGCGIEQHNRLQSIRPDVIYFIFIFHNFSFSNARRLRGCWGRVVLWWGLPNTWIYRFLYRGVSMRNRMEYNGSAKRRLKLIVFPLSSHSDLLPFNSASSFFVVVFNGDGNVAQKMTSIFAKNLFPHPTRR